MSKGDLAMLAYGYILGIGLIATVNCMVDGSFILGVLLFAFHIWQAYQMILGILGFEEAERESIRLHQEAIYQIK